MEKRYSLGIGHKLRGGGGYKTGGWAHVKRYPYEKGGGGSFNHAGGGGGHKKFWGSFYAVA